MLYAGTESGELVTIAAAKGEVRNTLKLADKNLGVDYAGDDIVIADASDAIFGIDPATGAKKWTFSSRYRHKEPLYYKGVVVVRAGERELSVLEAESGSVLWQYSGKRVPWVYTTEEGLFVAEENGVKEYTLERTAASGITEKEVQPNSRGPTLAKAPSRRPPGTSARWFARWIPIMRRRVIFRRAF